MAAAFLLPLAGAFHVGRITAPGEIAVGLVIPVRQVIAVREEMVLPPDDCPRPRMPLPAPNDPSNTFLTEAVFPAVHGHWAFTQAYAYAGAWTAAHEASFLDRLRFALFGRELPSMAPAIAQVGGYNRQEAATLDRLGALAQCGYMHLSRGEAPLQTGP